MSFAPRCPPRWTESLFGKEFDSIADIIFGVAPTLMMIFLVLTQRSKNTPSFSDQLVDQFPFYSVPRCAWRASMCSRIPCCHPPSDLGKDFLGLPVPAAAGMIASLVLVLNSFDLRALQF